MLLSKNISDTKKSVGISNTSKEYLEKSIFFTTNT